MLVLSDDWNGPYVQIDGHAEVVHMPEAADGLVDYFRCISGEHPDWEEYREAMHIQGQVADPNHPNSLGSDRDWWIPGRRGRATRRLIRTGTWAPVRRRAAVQTTSTRDTLSKLATG